MMRILVFGYFKLKNDASRSTLDAVLQMKQQSRDKCKYMHSRLIYQTNIQVYNLYPTHKNATTSSDSNHFFFFENSNQCVCVFVCMCVCFVVNSFFFSLLHSNSNTFDTYKLTLTSLYLLLNVGL